MTYSIYALRDPETLEVKYVGLSSDPVKRLTTHLAPSAAPAVREWASSLSATPDLLVLEECANDLDARLKEQVWIARFPSGQLLNVSHGGELSGRGARGGRFSGIGTRLKLLREARSLGQHELSRMCGVPASIISRIESTKYKSITAETAVCLARALNTTVEYLVTGDPS